MTFFTFYEFFDFLKEHYRKPKTSHAKEKTTYTDQYLYNAFLPDSYPKRSKSCVSNYCTGKSHPYVDDYDIHTITIEELEDMPLAFISVKITDEKKKEDFEQLRSIILSSQNIIDDPDIYTEFEKIEDLFSLLYFSFAYLYNNQAKIYDRYKEKILEYRVYRKKAKKSESTSSEKKCASGNEPAIITALRHISNHMYSKIQKNEQRYHSSSIDTNLLSFGIDSDIPSTDESNERTLMDYFENTQKNLYLYGPGGVGKTTFLVLLMRLYHDCKSGYIPLYLSLADLKKYAVSTYDEDDETTTCIASALWARFKKCRKEITEINSTAISRYKENTFQETFKSFLNEDNSSSKVLLLLDGINEISIEKDSYIRKRLLDETYSLSNLKNVRIIATTRPLPISATGILSNSVSIMATGIEPNTLNQILTENNIRIPGEELLTILRIPLFLNMYLIVQKKNNTDALTRGAILYDFYNNISEHYCEKSHEQHLHKNDPERLDIIPVILDFILPAFAARMEMEDCFALPKSVLKEIVDNKSWLVTPFEEIPNNIFSNLYAEKEYLTDAINEIPSASSVLKLVRDQLSLFTVYSDINDELSFTHQYIRDYLAAIFRINAIAAKQFDKFTPYSRYLSSNLSSETLILADEILHYANSYNAPGIFFDALYSDDFMFYPMILTNLLKQLSLYNSNNLSSFHFEHIDFSKQCLSDYQFYNHETKQASSFSLCSFSNESVSSPDKRKKILHTIGFMTKPVLCELTIDESHIIYRIYDLLTMSVIDTNSIIYVLSDDTQLIRCNDLTVSSDLNYLALYNKKFSSNSTIYLFNRELVESNIFHSNNDCCTTVRFVDNCFYYLFDNTTLHEFNLSSNEETIFHLDNVNFHSEKGPLISQIDFTNEYVAEIDDRGNVLLYSRLDRFGNVFYYRKDTNETISVPSLLPQKRKSKNIYPALDYYFSLSAGYIYSLVGNKIYKRKLISDSEYELLISDIDNVEFNSFKAYEDKLFCIYDNSVEIYDIISGHLFSEIKIDELSNPGSTFCSTNYLIVCSDIHSNKINANVEYYTIVRINQEDSIVCNYKYNNYLTHSCPFGKDYFLLCYENNYLALVLKNDLSLIDCCFIENNIRILHLSANKSSNTIAFLFLTKTQSYHSSCQLKIFCINDLHTPIFEIDDFDRRNMFDFSENGHWLFISDSDNQSVEIYDTTNYFYKQEIVSINGHIKGIHPTIDGVNVIYETISNDGYQKIKNGGLDSNFYARITIDKSGNISKQIFSIPYSPRRNLPDSLICCELFDDIYFVTAVNRSLPDLDVTIEQRDPNDEKSILNTFKSSDFDAFYLYSVAFSGSYLKIDELLYDNNDDINKLKYYFQNNPYSTYFSDILSHHNCYYDANTNRLFGCNEKGLFCSIDLSDQQTLHQIDFTPTLLIKDCLFENCNFDVENTQTIIENNGGKIR